MISKTVFLSFIFSVVTTLVGAQTPVVLDTHLSQRIGSVRGTPEAWEKISYEDFQRLAVLALEMRDKNEIPKLKRSQLGNLIRVPGDGDFHEAIHQGQIGQQKIFVKTMLVKSTPRPIAPPNEIFWALLLSQLGVGPSFYGIVEDQDRIMFVFEWIEGIDLRGPYLVGPKQASMIFGKLKLLQDRFRSWKIPFVKDLQPFIEGDKHIWVVDPSEFPAPKIVSSGQIEFYAPDWMAVNGLSEFDEYLRNLTRDAPPPKRSSHHFLNICRRLTKLMGFFSPGR